MISDAAELGIIALDDSNRANIHELDSNSLAYAINTFIVNLLLEAVLVYSGDHSK